MCVGAVGRLQHRQVAAQAEEDATDQVDDVDRPDGAGPGAGEERAEGEQRAAEHERHGGQEVEPGQPAGRRRLALDEAGRAPVDVPELDPRAAAGRRDDQSADVPSSRSQVTPVVNQPERSTRCTTQ